MEVFILFRSRSFVCVCVYVYVYVCVLRELDIHFSCHVSVFVGGWGDWMSRPFQ